jgi:DnaJ-class molecular chaperone
MTISINCPGCDGNGSIKRLGNKKCDYCKGTKTVSLVKHLDVLKKHDAMNNVLHYQRRQSKTRHSDNRRKG